MGSTFAFQFKALFPSGWGAQAAVQRFLGYFQVPEPYLLDGRISACITVAQRVFFEGINQHACGEGCVPGEERGWEKLPCLV